MNTTDSTERENEVISNLFYTDPQRPASPLLAYYLLWLLRQKLYSARGNQDENVEAAHWHVSDFVQLLEGCAVADDLVIRALNRLYDRRLVEALDPQCSAHRNR